MLIINFIITWMIISNIYMTKFISTLDFFVTQFHINLYIFICIYICFIYIFIYKYTYIYMYIHIGSLDFFVTQSLEQACTQLLPLVCTAQRSYYKYSTQSAKDGDVNSENKHRTNDDHSSNSFVLLNSLVSLNFIS
jgi:hypothetical protein